MRRETNLPTIRVEVIPDMEELGSGDGGRLQVQRLLDFTCHDAVVKLLGDSLYFWFNTANSVTTLLLLNVGVGTCPPTVRERGREETNRQRERERKHPFCNCVL